MQISGWLYAGDEDGLRIGHETTIPQKRNASDGIGGISSKALVQAHGRS